MFARTFSSVALLIACLIIGPPAHAQSLTFSDEHRAQLEEVSTAYQALAKHVHPTVVRIAARRYSGVNGSSGSSRVQLTEQQSTGSGVLVDSQGYIVTNAHVVRGAHEVQVQLAAPLPDTDTESVLPERGPFRNAQIVGTDQETDLAVLKIEGDGYPFLEMGDSEDLYPGATVFAFGTPRGLDNSVSAGVVSATARQLQPEDPMIYIQTDAPINPGSSGGPLVNTNGDIVGINTLNLSQSGGSEGLGFAAPSNIVETVYEQIRDVGYVRRGVIGVHAQTVTPPMANALGLTQNDHVVLGDVYPNSPARAAGLRPGDVVRRLGDKQIENARQLDVNLYQHAIGSSVDLHIVRNGEAMRKRVRVVERDDAQSRFGERTNPADHLVEELGILGLPLDDELRRMLPQTRFDRGVLVAASSGQPSLWGNQLQPGDIIYALDDRRIETLQHLRQALLTHEDDDVLIAQVQRGATLQYITFSAIGQ